MSSPRLVGIDVARATAIFGMFVAHLAVDAPWTVIADGRPSALFAVLAGCGIAFISRSEGATSRIVMRAVGLFFIGIALMFLGTPIAVILSSYALLFVLVLPFLSLGPRRLFAWAGLLIVLAPPIVAAVRIVVNGRPEPGRWIPGLAELFTGYYPAVSWLAYALAGLAIIRLPIRQRRTQLGLLAAGIGLAAAGYGAGYLTQNLLLDRAGDAPGLGWEYAVALVSPQPHTDSGPEILGNIGVAFALVAACLLLVRPRVGAAALAPLATAGSMSLTIYVGHLFYIAVLGEAAVRTPASNWPLIWLIVGSVAFAMVWHRFFNRGPLEWALHRFSTPRQEPLLLA